MTLGGGADRLLAPFPAPGPAPLEPRRRVATPLFRAPGPDRTDPKMFAVISDRGNQATVHVGDIVLCDYQSDWSAGDSVTFDNVLLMGDEGEVSVGTPTVAGAKVTGEVVEHCRGKKEVVFRFKRRKNVRVKRGHRQDHTRVRITGIEGA